MKKHSFKYLLFYSALVLLPLATSCKKEEPAPPLDVVCSNTGCFSIAELDSLMYTLFLERGIGYAYSIYHKDKLQKSRAGGLRSRTLDPAGQKVFDEQTNIHIASVSKPITTVAVLNLLEQKGVGVDAKIIDYLPAYWSKGKNMDKITFKDLLTHRSGIRVAGANFLDLKKLVATGVEAKDYGVFFYHNVNFCIFRILIPTLGGYKFPNGAANEAAHDIETQNAYVTYVNKVVFNPLSLKSDCRGDQSTALIYKYPYDNKPGVRTSDLTSDAGGFGWYVTATDLGKVFAHLNSTNKILSSTMRNEMFSKQLGCFAYDSPKHGRAYQHSGLWIWCIPQCGEVHTCMVMFPNDITVTLICNAGPFPYRTGIVGFLLDSWEASWR